MSSEGSEFKDAVSRLYSYLTGIEYVALSCLIFFSINIIVFSAVSRWPWLARSLSLSATRPWGIFTAVFVHDGLEHLISNLEAFSLWGGAFIILMIYAYSDESEYLGKVFFAVPYLSGFLVDGIRFFQWRMEGSSLSALGSSGVVYALVGVFLASALFSFSSSLDDLFRRRGGAWEATRLVLSVGAILLILFQVTSDTKSFLSVAPGVGVFAHGYGFLAGFFISGSLYVYYSLRKSDLILSW